MNVLYRVSSCMSYESSTYLAYCSQHWKPKQTSDLLWVEAQLVILLRRGLDGLHLGTLHARYPSQPDETCFFSGPRKKCSNVPLPLGPFAIKPPGRVFFRVPCPPPTPNESFPLNFPLKSASENGRATHPDQRSLNSKPNINSLLPFTDARASRQLRLPKEPNIPANGNT